LLVGYDFHYDLPLSGTIGGVGIFVKTTLDCTILNDFKIVTSDQYKVENLWMEVKKNTKTYIIGGIYRHPGHDIKNLEQNLDIIFSKIQQRRLLCIIAGDINIDLLKYSLHSTNKGYIDNFISNNILPVIVMPTRITDRSATLVDHIYYSEGSYKNNNNLVKSGNIWCDITDHLPNYILTMNNGDNREKNQNDQLPLVPLFSGKNIQKFKEKLELVDWSTIYNCNDVNAAYTAFHEILNNCYEDSFPYVRLSRKRSKD